MEAVIAESGAREEKGPERGRGQQQASKWEEDKQKGTNGGQRRRKNLPNCLKRLMLKC